MITLFDLAKGTSQAIEPTIFPDGTSQVWKLDSLEPFTLTMQDKGVRILWNYESEQELLHLCQLLLLVRQVRNPRKLFLDIPYYPYSRQDKNIDNESTFSQAIICNFLERYLQPFNEVKIRTLDKHSDHWNVFGNHTKQIQSGYTKSQQNIIPVLSKEELEGKIILFPDQGAFNRYRDLYKDYICTYAIKHRDQKTGNITDISIANEFIIKGNEIVVVDDLCDGGGTFTGVASLLDDLYSGDLTLFVTHGIFSKGLDSLLAYYKRIITTDSCEFISKHHDQTKILVLASEQYFIQEGLE